MVEKRSNTGIGTVPPIVAYSDGMEAQDVAFQFIKVYPANIIGANAVSSSLDDSDLSITSSQTVTDEELEKESDSSESESSISINKNAPTLMDIELVSNKIIYDAAGNPSSTVTFKVRNSSGQSVKAVNARIKVI